MEEILNKLYDYFEKLYKEDKISQAFLIGNVLFDDVKDDLNKIFKEFIFENNLDIENNPEIENSSEDEIFPEADLEEIEKLRSIIPYLRDPEALNKVIWKVYYEKPYTDLIGRVVNGNKTGIYKITN